MRIEKHDIAAVSPRRIQNLSALRPASALVANGTMRLCCRAVACVAQAGGIGCLIDSTPSDILP